jgi:hypothetical protein
LELSEKKIMILIQNAILVTLVSLGINSSESISNTGAPTKVLHSFELVLETNLQTVIFQKQRGGQARRGGQQQRGGRQQERGGQRQNTQQQNGQSDEGQQGNGQRGLNAEQAAQRMLQNFDSDGDGALNQQELTEGLRALEQAMRQRQGQQQQGQRPRGKRSPNENDDADAATQQRATPRGGGQRLQNQRRRG